MVEPEQAIDRINRVFGSHPGARALHAKGGFYRGTFTATPEAAALSRAGHLQGDRVDVRVRWSNGAGNPDLPDKAPDVRGMAVSFRLADGTATDLLGQTAPRFPVRTPEDFLAFVAAAQKPLKLPLFLAQHPSAVAPLLANIRAKALGSPASYADLTYYPVHAYRWIDAEGRGTWVRYRLVPIPGPGWPTAGFDGPDRLRDELLARLAAGRVRYDLRITTAAHGDDPRDPMSVWKGERELSAGVIEVTDPDPERETGGEIVVFDPTRVVDGIELSDDPILRYRAPAYSVSASRRAG